MVFNTVKIEFLLIKLLPKHRTNIKRAIRIDNDQINNILSEQNLWEESGLGKTGEAYIVASDHLIRSTSRFWTQDKEQYKQDVKSTGVPQSTIKLMEGLDTTIDLQEIPSPIVDTALAGDIGITVDNNYRGKEVITTYGPLNIPGLDWALIAELETREAYAPLRTLLITLAIAGVIFLLLTTALAAIASKLLLKPLGRLIESTNKIAAGELDLQVGVHGNSEFGKLGEAIAAVAGNLHQTYQELFTQKQTNEALLDSILTPAIAKRKAQGESIIADKLNKVTIVYAHLIGVNGTGSNRCCSNTHNFVVR